MLEYIKELSGEEQDRMQEVLGQLYRQTFLLERKYDKRSGRLVSNKEYYFCERHMEFLTDYLAVAGIVINRDTELGVISIQGLSVLGERLPKLATIYVLLFKLLYDEQMASVSNSVNIITTFGQLSAKAAEFRLTRSLSSITEIRRALAVLKKYQMIEPLDTLEELEENSRILIYPSINLVLMREDVRQLLETFSEEGEQQGQEDSDEEGMESVPDEPDAKPDGGREGDLEDGE